MNGLTKSRLLAIHTQKLQDNKDNVDHTDELLDILGGIDNVLSILLSSNDIKLKQDQLTKIDKIINPNCLYGTQETDKVLVFKDDEHYSTKINVKMFDMIANNDKYLVSGYCRKSNKDKQEIIGIIIKLITLFYYEYDEWSNKYKANTFIINGNIIKKIMGKRDSSDAAYLSNIIFGGKHHWKFKLKTIQTQFIRIGIWKHSVIISDKHINHCSLNKYPNTSYIFDSRGRINYHNHFPKRYSDSDSYGVRLTQNGTILDMFVDFNNLELSFAINGHNYGKSHNIDNCKYRAAISCREQGTEIQLLSYHSNWK